MTIEFTHDDISNEELERREAVYGPLAATVMTFSKNRP